MSDKYVVIMAGGIGSRFWPSSTEHNPKQFLDILGVGKSLLRITYERVSPLIPDTNILILTNKDYKELVMQHLPELPETNILCEPSRNNTAPCIAYATLHINARNKNAALAVLPSDHIIVNEDQFRANLLESFDLCSSRPVIVTLGIKPSRPDTGYGYIKIDPMLVQGANKVLSFKEKPDHATAEKYLQSGDYVWNAGMFIFQTSTMMLSFVKYFPSILDILNQKSDLFNTAAEEAYINEVYPLTENISIDYAIMEKSKDIYCITADFGWNDLGTWASLYDFCEKDDDANVTQASQSVLIEVGSSIIKLPEGKRAIIRGLQDFIVIDEQDALLIFPKNKEQEIKEALKKL